MQQIHGRAGCWNSAAGPRLAFALLICAAEMAWRMRPFTRGTARLAQ